MPKITGLQMASTIFLLGMLCIYVVWDCDRQRQLFRNSHGKCQIWGRIPTKVNLLLILHTHHENFHVVPLDEFDYLLNVFVCVWFLISLNSIQ